MMNAIRMAVMTIRLVMRMKVALFFTFVFPVIFLFVYAGIFAHGNPAAVAFMFGPVLTLNIMGAGFWGLGLQAVMQRERGTLRRYRLAPISSLTIVASNLLANYLLQIPVVGLLVFCAVFIFHMPLTIGLFPLWILMSAGMFAFAGFGLTLASVANTMQEVQVYNNLVWLSLLFLSGVTIPLAVLPGWVQNVAVYLPATYLVSSFQAIMGQAEPMSAHLPEMAVLILSGFFGVSIAWKLFRWEKEERIPTSGKLWALALLVPFLLMGTWMTIYANPKPSWQKSYSLMETAASREGSKRNNAEEFHYDFESAGDALDIVKTWHVSSDTPPATLSSASGAEISLISPGANNTQHALRIHGHLGSENREQAFVQARAELTLPATIKDFHGIAFWVRSDDSRIYQFSVGDSGSDPSASPELRLAPSHDWEWIHLPAPHLTIAQKLPPQPIPFVLKIKTSGPAGDFSVDIDELQSY